MQCLQKVKITVIYSQDTRDENIPFLSIARTAYPVLAGTFQADLESQMIVILGLSKI